MTVLVVSVPEKRFRQFRFCVSWENNSDGSGFQFWVGVLRADSLQIFAMIAPLAGKRPGSSDPKSKKCPKSLESQSNRGPKMHGWIRAKSNHDGSNPPFVECLETLAILFGIFLDPGPEGLSHGDCLGISDRPGRQGGRDPPIHESVFVSPGPKSGKKKSMVMKFHGNVRGEVRVNFLALFASKPHSFTCGALKLSRIVRANFRLNIAIPMLFLSLTKGPAIRKNSRSPTGIENFGARMKISSEPSTQAFVLWGVLRVKIEHFK